MLSLESPPGKCWELWMKVSLTWLYVVWFLSSICNKSAFSLPWIFALRGWAVVLWHSQASGGCRLSADPVSNVAHWLPWCCRGWEYGSEKGLGLSSSFFFFFFFLSFALSLSCTCPLSHFHPHFTFSPGYFKAFITLFMWFLWTFSHCSSPILALLSNTLWRVLHHAGLNIYIYGPLIKCFKF